MSKQKGKILDVVSKLDEEIVEKASRRRFSMFMALKARQKKRRNLFISIGSVAACLAILLPVILTLLRPDDPTTPVDPPVGGQVPIYTGMTMSNEYIATASTPAYAMPATLARGNGNGNNGNHFGNDNKPIGDAAADELGVTPSAQDKYYTTPQSDIYITVHFENPDEYEILSFRLNGVKYAVQQFLPGSDMENLIVKVNVGDVEGLLEYKITEIKYVDGESITERDVVMRGEDTIKVYVSYKEQPAATISGETVSFDSISFSASITDPNSLVAAVEGEMWAVLYDGETILQKKALALGDNAVSFEGLSTGTLYQYAVVAVYDSYDGNGKSLHVLQEAMVNTPVVAEFGTIEIAGDVVYFEIIWHEEAPVQTLSTLTLCRDGVKVRDLPIDATHVDGLERETTYELVATYMFGANELRISQSFTVREAVTVTFVTNGGEEMPPQQLVVGSALPEAVREGYTFGGWCQMYYYPHCETAVPAHDVTLYALWAEETNNLDFCDYGENGVEARVIAALWTPTERLHIPS